ncbi:MAG: hypothetical protein IJP92_05785 [Lachnospiraceae bacterium]|nr:hypothetical protein [Lachnospiraceae bacterium]
MDVSFSVGLKDPVSYSLIWFLVALALMAFGGIVFSLFYWRYRKEQAKIAEGVRVVKPPKVVMPFLKRKYGRQVARLDEALRNGQVEERIAYQELSRIIRAFAKEVTFIDVDKYTLSEIEMLNIPQLHRLVREYSQPEFSVNTGGNVTQSLIKTGQTIQEWR